MRRIDNKGHSSSTPRVIDGPICYAERAPNPPEGDEEASDEGIDTDGGGYELVATD
ncbi:hypothetical protein [Natrinema salsiterrestre]|uniref:Uncharacterized protein n=1 Tax=Natrinema salsiterrestre TaxID=2950540 RepID=A0A9Q4L295_9EURY|nr:hypothetical protein [Natrinema salsiterrestre]MDF9746304.1 hypothetical protein [Natrinema salsiterrestre]